MLAGIRPGRAAIWPYRAPRPMAEDLRSVPARRREGRRTGQGAMDAKANLKGKLPSRHATEGPERAPHRSFYYAMGLTREQIHQPFVAVARGDRRFHRADRARPRL